MQPSLLDYVFTADGHLDFPLEPHKTAKADGTVFSLEISGRPSLFREGVKKSKWKSKMAFAIRGGGVSRGSRLPLSYFEK